MITICSESAGHRILETKRAHSSSRHTVWIARTELSADVPGQHSENESYSGTTLMISANLLNPLRIDLRSGARMRIFARLQKYPYQFAPIDQLDFITLDGSADIP